MVNYDLFSNYYDDVMGDRFENAAFLRRIIKKYHPSAKTILELACGTGSVLQHFAKYYDVYGLDISSGMLAVAKRKIPSAKFSRQDMARFELNKKFDVIFCVYDSINHLLKFSDWQKVFKQAEKHLNKNGILIFDMNTIAKLQRIINTSQAFSFNKHVALIDITDVGAGISNWNIKVFERQRNNKYALYEENIKEKSFPSHRVKKALKQFRRVDIIDAGSKRSSIKSQRLIFVCKK